MKLMPSKYRVTDFDSREATEDAAQVLRNKKCLRDIYTEQYHLMMRLRGRFLVDGGRVLEIGSGGGFVRDLYPEVITSEVERFAHVDLVFNAEILPLSAQSLDAILAVNVLHHLPDVTNFLNEADRTLKVGGGIICIEPYWSPFARLIYKKAHPEPFDEHAVSWRLKDSRRMSSSNQALSYLLLKRDKAEFTTLYPQFSLVYARRFGFVRYMLTGGITLSQMVPDVLFPLLKGLEWALTPLMPLFALHHLFVWRKER
jgi:SAM-dependent methyltransferase